VNGLVKTGPKLRPNLAVFRHLTRRIAEVRGNTINRYSDHTQKWHTLVRLDTETYKNLKAYMTELATKRSKEDLEDAFRSVWFQPYRPVREQLLNIHRAVNRKRKQQVSLALTGSDRSEASGVQRESFVIGSIEH
jgi:hypothetical protein